MQRHLFIACLLLPSLFACAASAPRSSGSGGQSDSLETALPEHFDDAVKSAAHTSFVPRKPARSCDPLVARYESRGQDGVLASSLCFARDAARVFLGDGDGQTGWYFAQNPLDPAQFKAWRIDDSRGLLIEHSFCDVINEGVAESWDQVAGHGIDDTLLASLRGSGETEQAFGATFLRFLADEPRADGIVELWWSRELCLPLRVVRASTGGPITQSLSHLERGSGGPMLNDPAVRLPKLRTIDLADWREDNHDHAGH